MDGSTAPQVDIEAKVRLIKERMPDTYRSIQAKAAEVGREAYAWVRRGIAGQPNMFWACERGHVVGTPFILPEITAPVAQAMVMFGSTNMVIWRAADVKEAADGT